jgi:hypothetical protein
MAEAAAAAKLRWGEAATGLSEVTGERERAICGRVGPRRFVYRAERKALWEDEWPPETFTAIRSGWCGPS